MVDAAGIMWRRIDGTQWRLPAAAFQSIADALMQEYRNR